MIKTDAGRLLKQNIYLSLYCNGSKRLFKVCVWEGAGDRTELKYFDPHSYGRQRCLFLILQMLNWRPRAHSAGWWLSLLHLISNFSGPQTRSGFPRAPSAGCGFPCHNSPISISNATGTGTRTGTQLSYIIVQRPLDRPHDLWNRMFNRHQAEITIMQFRGHSLPVRQSIRVAWDFLACLILFSQFPPTRFPPLTSIGMWHFLPVHDLEWHFGPGRRSK